MSECYIGLISGTSMDGVDAALVELDSSGIRLIATHGLPYTAEIRDRLRRVVDDPEAVSLDAIGELDTMLGEYFARAANELIRKAGPAAAHVRAIGSHGQTVRHSPTAEHPFTIQLGDPNIIAAHTGLTTVADFRRRDVALGGEGAPLTPGFHEAVFADARETRLVVNVGGIANVTLLPARGDVSGFDTGPGNVLMDLWVQEHRDTPWDGSGNWAATGAVHSGLLRALRADPYFSQPPPKSTGREHFNAGWLADILAGISPAPGAADVQATLCELTAGTVADAINEYGGNPARVLVCGGGAHNKYLMERLNALLPAVTVESTAAGGIDPDWVEAAAFAWLAHRTLRGEPGNLPLVTGARALAVLGGIYGH